MIPPAPHRYGGRRAALVHAPVPPPSARLPEPLTGREAEMVRPVTLGRTRAGIAAELYVSLSTVETHLSGVRLGPAARNRAEIAPRAWQHGRARPGS